MACVHFIEGSSRNTVGFLFTLFTYCSQLYFVANKYIINGISINESVQALMKEHFEIACCFYNPSKEAYIGMGIFYKENDDMKKFHNSYHPEMVNYLGDAIVHYAGSHL